VTVPAVAEVAPAAVEMPATTVEAPTMEAATVEATTVSAAATVPTAGLRAADCGERNSHQSGRGESRRYQGLGLGHYKLLGLRPGHHVPRR
jgi:hypothetical protein